MQGETADEVHNAELLLGKPGAISRVCNHGTNFTCTAAPNCHGTDLTVLNVIHFTILHCALHKQFSSASYLQLKNKKGVQLEILHCEIPYIKVDPTSLINQ